MKWEKPDCFAYFSDGCRVVFNPRKRERLLCLKTASLSVDKSQLDAQNDVDAGNEALFILNNELLMKN